MEQEDTEPFSGLEEVENLTIYGAAGSEAQKYAQEHQIPFTEDPNLQSTIVTPEPEKEEEVQKEEEEPEEQKNSETAEISAEDEVGQEKAESPDKTIILGLTIGAAVLLILVVLLMIRVIRKNRKR